MNEYSIWLVPAEPWLDKFRSIIRNIAKENNTFSFEPHITILVKNDEESKMVDVVQALAKKTNKPTVKFTDIGYEDTYFRAIYLRAQRQNILDINTMARKIAGMFADPQYMPHLSLLYGNLDGKTKETIIKNLGLKLSMEVVFDKLSLWRTGYDITVDKWKKVADISCQK
ncbi:MAG: hypothetical protein HY513_03320 [Candidatus Aenigmarchaeota archaeon]|nr:hypothetical protein [Candidatus Aenigmarchaeota archaeon]